MTQGDAQNDPLVGTLVANKYRIVRLLGEGGMGCVYLAEQQLGATTRKVAVKTLHRNLSQDDHIRKRFEREVSTVVALEHPNTIQVFDYGTMDDGQLYIVMEYVQGRSVADILEKEGPMPPERVENILRQVCGSLEEAHGHGIVHRDLKPDNVVLTERAGQKDWVEVLDFGIAKRSSEHDPNEAKLTQQGMVLGTPPYMSPEQFTGVPIDARSDIYSLGIMAYEMLTGRLPFDANTAWEWASKHMTEPPIDINNMPNGMNIPDRARTAIMRALAKNRDERFASVKDFYEAFSSGAAGGTGVMPMAAADAPAVSSAGRAKTEMAQPMMAGPPPGMAPPGAPTPAPVPIAAPAMPAAAPAMHAASPPQKKGGAGALLAVAGVIAVITIVGVVVLVMKRNTKTPVAAVPTTETSTTSTTTSASVAHTDEPPPAVTTAEPLTPPPATPVANNTPPATKPGTKPPATKPGVKPPPEKPKPDPPECVSYRKAKAGGQAAAIVNALAARCAAAGGHP